MKRRMTEIQLCAKYHNENPHTEHVTYLALKLLDGISEFHALSQADRRMLESACRLHDLGFMIDPRNHALASSRIIHKEGIAGLTDRQRSIVAAAILLHPRRYKRMMEFIDIKKGEDLAVVMKIASILRIADALDHAHLQDVDILSVKLVKRTVQVELVGMRYEGIIGWAYDKSDLFRKTYGKSINFTNLGTEKEKVSRYMGLVGRKDSVLKGARSILCYLFRSFSDYKRGAMNGADIEHLHEMRVLIRRFLVAMRYFSPYWDCKDASRLRKKAKRFCAKLGDCRDLDVWLDFLSRKGVKTVATSCSSWLDFYAEQEQAREQARKIVVNLLGGSLYTELVQQTGYFIRVGIPGLMLVVPEDRYRDFTGGQVRRMYSAMTRKRCQLDKMSVKKMHSFRKELRKFRYAVEFTLPVSSPDLLIMEKSLNSLTDILGDIHDMDVHAMRVIAAKNAPKGLLAYISAHKKRAIKKFPAKWDEFTSRAMRRIVMTCS